jgi:hypothetical protein
MEEAPENGKELSHSAHANGMNECAEIEVPTQSLKGYGVKKVTDFCAGI